MIFCGGRLDPISYDEDLFLTREDDESLSIAIATVFLTRVMRRQRQFKFTRLDGSGKASLYVEWWFTLLLNFSVVVCSLFSRGVGIFHRYTLGGSDARTPSARLAVETRFSTSAHASPPISERWWQCRADLRDWRLEAPMFFHFIFETLFSLCQMIREKLYGKYIIVY